MTMTRSDVIQVIDKRVRGGRYAQRTLLEASTLKNAVIATAYVRFFPFGRI